MLGEACRQLAEWRAAGRRNLRVTVNLSARQFADPGLIAAVAEALARADLPADALWLEITESVLMEEVEATAETLHALKRLGVHLAVDDFGTGYSALSRLRGFPFHTLKIDRSFISEIEDSSDEAPIVAAMIAMAHAMKLDVVAEGVETNAQRAYLGRHGCDIAQGYLFSRPVEAELVEKMLAPVAA